MKTSLPRPFDAQVHALKQRLRASILRGELSPGSQLVESDLRREMGASIRAVRKALMDMAAEGLVTRKRHAGTFVAEIENRPLSEGLPGIHTVGLLSSYTAARLERSEFMQLVMSGIRGALASPAKIIPLLHQSADGRDLNATPPISATTLPGALQGIVALETTGLSQLNDLARAGVGLVSVDFAPADALFDSICVDHIEAGFLATQHLLALGHRQIAFVGEAPSLQSTDPTWQQRLTGFLRALSIARINATADWVLDTYRSHLDVQRRLAEFHRTRRPTAYVLCSHSLFPAFERELSLLGLSFPKDVSVSIADVALPESLRGRALSCVNVNYELLGQGAVTLLAARLACRSLPPLRTVIPASFRAGQSSRPPAG